MSVKRWGWYSVAMTAVIGGVHAAVAAASGSLAVSAEVVHNTTDLLTALAVVAGLKLATYKSVAFPYGLYKLENVIAVGLAGAIFVTAYEIARDAFVARPAPLVTETWMLAALAVTTVAAVAFAHFELRVAKAANSPALTADAKEYRIHVFTTGTALAALLGQRLDLPLDRPAAVVIVIAVTKVGWDLLADGMRALLDASLDAKTIENIRREIQGDPAVAEVKWVSGRNAGRFRFVEAAIVLRLHDLVQAEAATRRIEEKIRRAVPHLERILIRAEPLVSEEIRYAVPLADSQGATSEHFGEAPYFALVAVSRHDGSIAEWRIVANPHCGAPRAKGIRVAEWLASQKVDVVLVKEDLAGKGPGYVLGNAGVAWRVFTGASLNEALRSQRHTPPDTRAAHF